MRKRQFQRKRRRSWLLFSNFEKTYVSDDHERVGVCAERTLPLTYFERTEEVLQAKWYTSAPPLCAIWTVFCISWSFPHNILSRAHQDYVDANYASREERILQTTLLIEDIVLELNPFPYQTPEGVTHWTLWAIRDMEEEEIEDFVSQWIASKICSLQTGEGKVLWNYDANESRSIDLFHVHVYIQTGNIPLEHLQKQNPHTWSQVDSVNKRTRRLDSGAPDL